MTASINTNAGGELETLLRGSVAVAAGRAPIGVALRCAPVRVADSNAVKLRRMRKAGEPFLGVDAARELVNSIGFSLVNDPNPDAAEMVRESIARLVKLDGRCNSPRVPSELDVEGCVEAMASKWSGS